MLVGDSVRIVLENRRMDTVTGTVVYIHPKRRYYVVEYLCDGKPVRESFPFQHRGGGNEKRPLRIKVR